MNESKRPTLRLKKPRAKFFYAVIGDKPSLKNTTYKFRKLNETLEQAIEAAQFMAALNDKDFYVIRTVARVMPSKEITWLDAQTVQE